MAATTQKAPPVVPRWLVRTIWVLHRTAYSITGGRFGLRTPTDTRWGMLRLKTVGRRTGRELTISLLGTPSGRSPLHDRFLLGPTGGVSFGSSANSIGVKDTAWRDLTVDECAAQEAEVMRWLAAAAPIFEGEPLRVTTFSLSIG